MLADVLAARRDRLRRRHAAGEEAVGEPDGAELEAAGGERLALLADQQLGRAAADVDEQQPAVEHRHGLQHAEVDQPGLLDARDDLDLDAGLARGPGRGTRRRWRPRAPRWWPRPAAWRRSCRRCGASGAGRRRPARWRRRDSSFMSPPPWPRRTTSFSRVSVSKRSPPTGRATTRWKLFVPMSSAASTGPSTCSSGVVTIVSLRSGRVQASQPVQHTLRGSWRSSRTRCRARRRSTPSSPTTSAVWIASSRSPGSIVAVARVAARPVRRGSIVCAQAPVRQSSSEEPRLALQRAAERDLGGLAPRPAEDVADDEVAEAVVQVAGERLVEEDLVASPGSSTAPVANDAGRLVARRRRRPTAPARRVSVGIVTPCGGDSAGDQYVVEVGRDERRRSAPRRSRTARCRRWSLAGRKMFGTSGSGSSISSAQRADARR